MNSFLGKMLSSSVVLLMMFATVGSIPSAAAGTLAQFRTVLGDINVELFDEDKPVTVQNFIRYARTGSYQDSILHRCPANPETGLTDFVVQGGGLFVTNRGTTNSRLISIQTFADITNEFAVGRRFSNTYGTIAMAKRSGDTNSASSQWFFNLKDNSFLDATNANSLFVVFGRVVGGTNVLNQFIGRSYTNGLADLGPRVLGGVLRELPVNFSGVTNVLHYQDLFFVDVSLLNVAVRAVEAGGREISWQSVSNRVNIVEFTEMFPPRWQTLHSEPGTGGILGTTDASGDAAPRFYRVRVDY